jgi:predicted nucleic acid-binding protein
LGNVLWKEAKTRGIDYKEAAQVFSDALSELRTLNIDNLHKVLTTAIEKNLTFYDASYAYIAEKEKLTLVTENAELLKKCKCALRTKDVKDLQLT